MTIGFKKQPIRIGKNHQAVIPNYTGSPPSSSHSHNNRGDMLVPHSNLLPDYDREDVPLRLPQHLAYTKAVDGHCLACMQPPRKRGRPPKGAPPRAQHTCEDREYDPMVVRKKARQLAAMDPAR